MSNQNTLIDRTSLLKNRMRFDELRSGFLQDEAIIEAKGRLGLVNKDFKSTAIITPFPQFWRKAFPKATMILDDDFLNFKGQKFDLVLHVMSLHWSNDPLGQLIQCMRALRPDGLFISSVMGGETLHELRSALAKAENDVTGGLSPRVLPMADIRDLGALLQRAGFALPVVDSVKLTATYETPYQLLRELRTMGGTNAQTARQKTFTRRSIFKEMYKNYADHFSDKNDKVIATFEMFWLTGWAPSQNQPKPLRPGSAKMRLSDALQVEEKSLKD